MEKPALRAADFRFDRTVSCEPASTRITRARFPREEEVGGAPEKLVADANQGSATTNRAAA
jgi:hypothetical protein